MKIEESIQTSKFNTPNVAVFLIDVQESLLNGIKNKDQLIDALNILIQSTKIFNLPFITIKLKMLLINSILFLRCKFNNCFHIIRLDNP